MSDQCKNCTLRGDYEACIKTECFHHENWINVERIKRINNLERQLAEAREIIEECLSRTSDGNFKDCIRRRIKKNEGERRMSEYNYVEKGPENLGFFQTYLELKDLERQLNKKSTQLRFMCDAHIDLIQVNEDDEKEINNLQRQLAEDKQKGTDEITQLKLHLAKREDDYRKLRGRSDEQIDRKNKELAEVKEWLEGYLDMPDGYRAIGFSDIQKMYNELKDINNGST